jgi:hypothetical protein
MISHLLSKTTKELYSQPKKQKLFGKNYLPEEGYHQQIDILYLPSDNGFKYLLNVIDLYDSQCDAIALKKMEMENLIHALQHLYDNSMYLVKPRLIQADQQFNNKIFRDWCDENDINFKFSNTNDHLAMSHVERLNKTLGTWIHQLQVEQEVQTGQVSTEWVGYLKTLIAIINERHKLRKPKKIDESIRLNNTNNTLILPDTQVRLKLDVDTPRDVFGNKLHGNIRAGDIKWTKELYEVVAPIFIPGNIPFYKVRHLNGRIIDRLFSRERLQVI